MVQKIEEIGFSIFQWATRFQSCRGLWKFETEKGVLGFVVAGEGDKQGIDSPWL